MLKFIRVFSLFLALTIALPAMAAPALPALPGITPAAPAETVTFDQESLKKLITTLESDTARTDFITNLKTLADTQKTEPAETPEEKIAPITKTLGVDSFTTRLIDTYQNFLSRNNLNGSTVGKLMLSVIITLVGLGALLLLRRGATHLLYFFDRAVTWLDLPAARMRRYAKILRSIVTIGAIGLLLYTYTLIWNYAHDNPFESIWFKKGLRTAINVGFVMALATLVWEVINALLVLTFHRMDGRNSGRVKTILPMVRNVLFVVFAVLFGLMLLSELGIDIVPLMAGAGIVGVAIGFGAQTMVKDFLSGFTIVLEDVIRVGDVIRLGALSGTVEKITLRKVQMRGTGGTVYTIPFSAITTIENMTKDFSSYEFTINVPLDADTDKVFGIIRDVSEGMQADPAFGSMILESVDIWGVDAFTDNSTVIKGRIKTVAGKQWAIQREFNRRRKIAFAAHGIQQAVIPQSFQINRTLPPITDPKPEQAA